MLELELWLPAGHVTPEHVHPEWKSAGRCSPATSLSRSMAEMSPWAPGDTVAAGAGAPHGSANVGRSDAHLRLEFRPALRSGMSSSRSMSSAPARLRRCGRTHRSAHAPRRRVDRARRVRGDPAAADGDGPEDVAARRHGRAARQPTRMPTQERTRSPDTRARPAAPIRNAHTPQAVGIRDGPLVDDLGEWLHRR